VHAAPECRKVAVHFAANASTKTEKGNTTRTTKTSTLILPPTYWRQLRWLHFVGSLAES
jgi:hypothetical protein